MEGTASSVQTRNPGFRRVRVPYKLHTLQVSLSVSTHPSFFHTRHLPETVSHPRCKHPILNTYSPILDTNKKPLSKIPRSDPSSPKPADAPAPSSSSSVDPQAIRAEVEKLVAEGKKAIALHEWEQGVDRYATALDRMCVSSASSLHIHSQFD